MESGDVGCVATSAKRHLAGSVPGMTALVEVTDTYRAPKVRHCLPPSRKLIKPLRSTFYMPNGPLAPVEHAQAAINNIANQLPLSKGMQTSDMRISRSESAQPMKSTGWVFDEGLEKRQPNGNQSTIKSQKEERT